MPIINVDVKSLEVVVAADLSRDAVMMKEIINKEDMHENNRVAFNLPSRLIAKVFVFRLLYGGSAYSYANDPDFKDVGLDEKGWQQVIDNYYVKYKGIADWHKRIVEEVQATQRLSIPSGRYYPLSPTKNTRGELKWPITMIKNYPCQGFGSDLVMLARLEARKLLKASGLKADLVGSIHDSIICDAPTENVMQVGKLLLQAVESVPMLCKKVWNYDFSLPLTGEVSYGPNKKDLEDLKMC